MGNKEKTAIDQPMLNLIAKQISETRYGSVTIIIQDGRIVQVEKNEKIRFTDCK